MKRTIIAIIIDSIIVLVVVTALAIMCNGCLDMGWNRTIDDISDMYSKEGEEEE